MDSTSPVYKLFFKLFDVGTFAAWYRATSPQLGNFLRSCGWEGTIVVVNKEGRTLHTIEPRNGAENPKQLRLVHNPSTMHFWLSTALMAGNEDVQVQSLFTSLAAGMMEQGLGEIDYLELLWSFDYFIKSEKDCPGLGKP